MDSIMSFNKSLKNFWVTSVFAFVIFICGIPELMSTPLPQDYPLVPLDEKNEDSDHIVSEWFGTYANKPNMQDFSKKEYLDFFETETPVGKSFFLLKNPKYFKGRKQDILEQSEIAYLLHDAKSVDDPLYPYALAELTKFLEGNDNKKIANDVRELLLYKGSSCPQNEMIKTVIADDFSSYTDTQKEKILGYIKKNPFTGSREALFSYLVRNLESDETIDFKKSVELFAKKEGVKGISMPWWEDDSSSAKLHDSELWTLKEEIILKKNKQRECDTAKKLLFDDLPFWVKDVDKFIKIARLTAKCQIPRKLDDRIGFWTELEVPLESLMPRQGKGFALLEQAKAYYHIDDFSSAIKVTEKILTDPMFSRFIKARAKYLQASIEENQNNFDAAMKHFEEYVQTYPGFEEHKDALRKLVLIYAESEKWGEMKKPLDAIVEIEDGVPEDLRGEDDLGFALFWHGRRALFLGQIEEAKVFFSRLSKELYSTFYGAMGHFLFEELSGKKMALEPNYNPDFKMTNLTKDTSDIEKEVFVRAEKLLSLGLTQEAVCEINQWEIKDKDYEKILLKTMVLNAAGRWLSAIKSYMTLPRSFRNRLPSGFEKIIFPKRFSEEVEQFAAKADLDPYLIYALIRQESVFNPMATSPAGALGVMQIMPKTALAISKKMKVKEARGRSSIAKKLRKSSNTLYEPEINIELGIEYMRRLIEIYQEPVYVLASYNAGEGKVKQWVKNFAQADMLTFIERIPYAETRTYVKLVLRNYFYYKRIYAGKELILPHLSFIKKSIIAEN